MSFLEKLADVEHRYESLTGRMADPALMADPRAFREIAKERAALEELVSVYRDYRVALAARDECRDILNDGSDPDLVAMAQDELATHETHVADLEAQIKSLLLPRDPNDDRNVLLEIRAGTGGDEAALFAGEMMRMYMRFAERHRWKVEPMSLSEIGIGGVKEAILLITGDAAYSQLKYESGVHRVQRVPATENQGRIHTSTVTVAVLPEVDDVEIQVDEKDLRIDVYRSSGPGGQSVNTTDSAVRITHIPTGLVVACQDEKSQHKNRAKALKILKSRLYDQMQAEQHAAISAERKLMVGSGERSEKIRTYNFPQSRCTDHRINFTSYRLNDIMQGDIDELITACRTWFHAEALKAAEAVEPA